MKVGNVQPTMMHAGSRVPTMPDLVPEYRLGPVSVGYALGGLAGWTYNRLIGRR